MFKKLKSLFIIEEEESRDTEPETSTTGTDAPANRSVRVSARLMDIEGKVNEKFLHVLLGAMDKNNLEGFDYLEFKEFLKSLSEVEMDESTKFRSAFATARTMGATQQNIRDSAQHYLDVLRKERGKFDQAVKNQKARALDQRNDEITHLKNRIKEMGHQIDQLQEQIRKAEQDVSTKQKKMESAEEKIVRTQQDFIETYDFLVGQIEEDIKKIDTFLS